MAVVRLPRLANSVLAVFFALGSASVWAQPTGAKAIFDSGSGGGTIGMSVGSRPAPAVVSAPVAQPYAGISYQILTIAADGQMQPVSKSRVFRSGERIKILASTNRSGYLTVLNVGSSGRTHVLFSGYVDARVMTQIPPKGNLRFDSNPGTENILVMLSDQPSPLASPSNQVASAPAVTTPPVNTYPTATVSPSNNPYPTSAGLPPPPPMPTSVNVPPPFSSDMASSSLVASLDSAKSMKAQGAKDLMLEDEMQSSYTVLSAGPDGYKAVRGGAKDLMVESSPDGTNYGLIPVSAIQGGGALTLEIKLKHR